jgi:homoaconitase/3-isopropylmalate dehydratase large subunit
MAPPASMTVVCGDSHLSTHGAFRCAALSAPTVEHVMAAGLLARSQEHAEVKVEDSDNLA